MAIGAFAGVRHEEIQRLDWQDIKLKAGIIEIRAAKAKTASRRTIPTCRVSRPGFLRPAMMKKGGHCEREI